MGIAADLHEDPWARIEPALRRFEEAWRSGAQPIMTDYLPADAADRRTLLVELVCTDLEYRLKAGLPTRAEHYLKEYPELAADPDAAVDLIAHEFELRHGRDPSIHVTEYLDRFPQHTQMLESRLAPIEKRADATSVGHGISHTLSADGAEAPTSPPNYAILGELGRGGMGVVYRARQIRLNRLVALKMILAGEHAGAEAARRFLAEAELVARLQHPGIVQVFEVGTHSGRAYLALEYVDGPSLDRLIAGTPQDPMRSARLVAKLAEAVAHAHERGIIHRDLKPANVLLSSIDSRAPSASGDRGPQPDSTDMHPKITDFGLAKQGDAGLTQSGAVLGTPSYMAPEQAAGKSHSVGPSADVYALGAILYEMLTGRPPFRGTSAWETVEQVLTQEPVPPCRLQPRVPRDLETICLKCLHKDASGRYATAQELAEDLDRFLRHVPIRARRITPLERAARWCRREPRTAVLLATIVLILTTGLWVTISLLFRGLRQEEMHFRELLADVEHGIHFAGREELTLIPQLDDNLRRFLERLAERSQRLLDQRHDDAGLRRRATEVQHQLGVIYQILGRHAEAESAFLAARSARAEILQGADRARQDELALALTSYQLGNLYVTLGRLQEADERLNEALGLQASASGSIPDCRTDRATTLHRLAGLQILVGRLREGQESYREALALRRALIAEQPDNIEAQRGLAQTETSLADFLVALSQFSEAEQLYAAAIGRLEKIGGAAAAAPGHRLALARGVLGLARLHENLNRFAEATSSYVRAVEIFKRVGEDHPHRPDYRLEMAMALFSVARFSNDGGATLAGYLRNNAQMEKLYRDAVEEQEKLVKDFPAVVEYRRHLALSLDTLATWVNDDAVEDSGEVRWDRVREAAALHQRAEDISRQLVADFPSVPSFRHGLTVSHQRYGIVLERLGRRDEAEERYREGLMMQKALVEQFPGMLRHEVALSALHNNLGVIHDRRRELAGAEQYFRQALVHSARGLELNPQFVQLRVSHGISLYNLASVVARQRRHGEAVESLREHIRCHNHPHWELRKPAVLLDSCIQLAEIDSALTDAERARIVANYTEFLMDIFRLQVARGAEAAHLEIDAVFKRLHQRPDYQQLLAELREREKLKK